MFTVNKFKKATEEGKSNVVGFQVIQKRTVKDKSLTKKVFVNMFTDDEWAIGEEWDVKLVDFEQKTSTFINETTGNEDESIWIS